VGGVSNGLTLPTISPHSERALAPAWAKRKEIKGYDRIALLGSP